MSKKIEILVVDDILENLQLVSGLLDSDSVNITVATSGARALDTISIDIPDIILLDIAMPDMDGYEVCKILKQDEKTKNIPVIFLTARIELEDIVKGFEVGAVDYVTKPFNATELISRVNTHLDLKKSKDLIKQQLDELKKSNATKDKFFSVIAHHLKNPFENLRTDTELLIKDILKYDHDEIKVKLNELFIASDKGYYLLENLLEWSKFQTGDTVWTPENFDVKSKIENTINFFRSTVAIKKGIITYMVVLDNTNVYADMYMFEIIIRNLISNALKYSNNGDEVMITAEERGDFIEISISDTGICMSNDVIEKLFKIDILHSTLGTSGEQGSGLGLILCKEFVEKNGGTINVESKKGKGTSVKFLLPQFDGVNS